MARSRRAVLLHAALLCSCIATSFAASESDQRDALIKLYKSVDATGTLIPKYNGDTNLCSMFGVTCSNDGYVESLSLTGQQHQGTLPNDSNIWEALGGSIKYLELSNIGITGSLPLSLQAMGETLLELKLNKNYLSGGIPEFTSFLQLQLLDLSDNTLNGSVPDSFSTATFPELNQFNLVNNPRLCASNAKNSKLMITMSPGAAAPACRLRRFAPRACDCLWAALDSYACSAAKADCVGQPDPSCVALKDGNVTLTKICSPNQPPPSPPPPPPSPPKKPATPPPHKIAPPPPAEDTETVANITARQRVNPGAVNPESSRVTGTMDPTFVANSTDALGNVCNTCLGSFNNTACKEAVCTVDSQKCGWYNAVVTPGSSNFTDSAEEFAGWLKQDAVCGALKNLQSPNICACRDGWISPKCQSAQLEACTSRKDLCYQIISAPTNLLYQPIINLYTNSCFPATNQTATLAGVQVSLFLIDRTVEDWGTYRQGVMQALSEVTGVPVTSITELSAVELPGVSSKKPLVQVLVHIATNDLETTFSTVVEAFKSSKFTQALSMQNVQLNGKDLYAGVEQKYATSTTKNSSKEKKSSNVQWLLIVLVCLGAVVLLVVVVVAVYLVRRNKRKNDDIWDMKFPPVPSMHNTHYSPKPSRSVRLDGPSMQARPGSLPPSAGPSPLHPTNPYAAMDPERPFGDPHGVPGPPIYAGSPYARARYDTTPTTQSSTANSRSNLLRNMGSAPHTPHQQPASPSLNPMNRDDAQAERAKFWAQFQLSWERQKARQASGVPNQPRVGGTFEDDEDIPSSGTSWTSQSDAKHAFRRY